MYVSFFINHVSKCWIWFIGNDIYNEIFFVFDFELTSLFWMHKLSTSFVSTFLAIVKTRKAILLKSNDII